MRIIVAVLLCGIAWTRPTNAIAADVDYATQVAPLFKKYCVGCHNSEDREGELSLDQFQAAMQGGAEGVVIVPGKSAESRMILALTDKVEPRMPPEDEAQPTAEEIATISAWIDAGAKGPVGDPLPTVLTTPKIAPKGNRPAPITALACSPQNNFLAVARYRGVDLLSIGNRTPVRTLADHVGRVNALCLSADGSLLAAAAGETGLAGEARLWNPATGALLKTFAGHRDSLYAVAISPSGKLLATGGYDQQIKLWDIESGKELRTLSGHNDAVFDLAFRPDGKILASASGDRTVKLWNVETGERLDTLGQATKELYTVAFSPDGQRVAAAGVDNRIRVWQVSPDAKENTNPILYSKFAHEGAVIKLVYTGDGASIVSAAEDRTMKVWEALSLVEHVSLERQPDWAVALAIGPQCKTVWVGRLDGTLDEYDLASGAKLPVRNELKTSSLLGAPGAKRSVPQAILASTVHLASPLASVGSILAAPLVSQAAAAPAKPELTASSIRGVQRGVASRLKLTGKELAGVTALKTSSEKLIAKIAGTSQAEEIEIEVYAGGDLPRGRYEVWGVTPAGETNHRELFVDELPQTSEMEPNDLPSAASPVVLPAVIWGSLAAKGEIDHFAFDGQAGQTIVFDVSATAIGSKANPVITILDANGRAVADRNDFDNQADPLVAVTIPSTGRYTLVISDLMRSGGGEHFYRITAGQLPYVTSVYPLSATANSDVEVQLVGHNLPGTAKVKLHTAGPGEQDVPLADPALRTRKSNKLLVGTLPETLETEPNDEPAKATSIAAPGVVSGRSLAAPTSTAGDADYFRFESKAGESWIIETDAARRGSPIDSTVEVLHADGRPVERLVLEATRDSYVTFRGVDATSRDIRLVNWEEMELNEYLYLGGEVCKLFRAPQGPDSGFLLYEADGGKRRGYFDTSATVHALDEPCYIVTPHPAGTKITSTGLPVIPVYYANDDDGQRRLGSDSRLTFTAPADGANLVRVRDSRGATGERFAYRLIVRRPQPDFNVSLSPGNPAIPAGSGKSFTVSLDRIDNFDGDVQIEITGLPAGIHAPSPLVIAAGHNQAQGVLYADADAPVGPVEASSQIKVQATATVAGQPLTKPVNNFGMVKVDPKPKLLVRMEPADITIKPGTTVTALLKVERNGYDDLVTFSVPNLPHGVIVDNIGLSGVLMPKGETQRQIFLSAARWVGETDRPAFANAEQEGGQASPPVVVHVRK